MRIPVFMFTLLVFAGPILTVQGQGKDAEQVVQANLDAYNNKDIDGFMAWFSPEIAIYNHGDCQATMKGSEAVRKRYQALFDNSPKLHSKILKRIAFGNTVIDHEYITGRQGASGPLELVLAYEVSNGKIFRITVMRK